MTTSTTNQQERIDTDRDDIHRTPAREFATPFVLSDPEHGSRLLLVEMPGVWISAANPVEVRP